MSDDTDPAPVPFVYDGLIRAFREDPLRLLYGAVVLDQGNPSYGFATWIPWFERWFVVAVSDLIPLEQISTAFVMTIMMCSALAMYIFGRRCGWSPWVATSLATAWAFNPFTRLRANVHFAMAGLYHLPLIFIALDLCARRRDRKSLVVAALCLLGASTSYAYLVIVGAALTPLYLIYVWLRSITSPRQSLTRFMVAALPTILFLGWNVIRPVPKSLVPPEHVFPTSGEAARPGQMSGNLKSDAARPYDYLTSDVALPGASPEWIPWRRKINEYALARIGTAPNERTNGIRWILITLAFVALVTARGSDRKLTWFFAGFAFACFWLSLPPDRPFAGAGPSGWLWRLVHQVRVPSRAGIGVHFGILGIVGHFLTRRTRSHRWHWLLLLAVLVDYPPFTGNISVAEIRPRFARLNRDGQCATGILYPPFVTDEFESLSYYHFKQRLRGTGCRFLNALVDPKEVLDLRRRFPRPPAKLEAPVAALKKLVRCAPLGWVVFEEAVPEGERRRVCTGLGWSYDAEGSCVDPEPRLSPLRRLPSECPP